MARVARLVGMPLVLAALLLPAAGAVAAESASPGSVIATIATGPRPQDVVVSPDGRFAYLTTLDDGVVAKIDLGTFTVVDQAQIGPSAGAIIYSNDRLVVASEDGQQLVILDPDTLTELGRVSASSKPIALTASADGYITVFSAAEAGVIGIIDDKKQYFDFVDIGGKPWGVDLFANDTRAVVANQTGGNVVITTLGTASESPKVIADVFVGGRPSYVAVAPDESVAYVANADRGAVDVIDLTTLSVTSTFAVGGKPWGVAVSWDGRYVYVPDNSNGIVTAINASTGVVVSQTATGQFPDFVGLSPDGTLVLVPNSGSNTLSIVQGHSSPPSGTEVDAGVTEASGGIDPIGVVAISAGGVVVLGGIGALIFFLVKGSAAGAAAAAAGGAAVAGAAAGSPARATGAAVGVARTANELDPNATPEQLAEYATNPELRPAVAAHPNTYPDLLTWLGSLGEPAVDAALRARGL